MELVNKILNYTFHITNNVEITVKELLILVIIFMVTHFVLKFFRRLITRKLNKEGKEKFKTLFTFLRYFIYSFVIILSLQSMGVKVSALLAASAALLVGVGLALQTLFQDILSGIFIITDKTLHINDIIQMDDKIGKVFEIRLRTTRAITIDDKVIIIPNHKFLTNTVHNWTQNGTQTTESINIGVAYGSNVDKVKQLLIEAAKEHPKILDNKPPRVLFMDFGDNALQFRLLFDINDSFLQVHIKSDLRYVINQKFRANNVQIPFPQRDIHIIKNTTPNV